MSRYCVEVCRIEWANEVIEVDAGSKEEAKILALEEAGDIVFNDPHDSECEVVDIWEKTK